MGHTIKGQRPREYRPSTTRRASGLERVNESHENAVKLWNTLRRYIKSNMKRERNIRLTGSVTRGRFKMSPSPKKKNKSPEVYKIGRFKVYSS
jgi:hypothetical protein